MASSPAAQPRIRPNSSFNISSMLLHLLLVWLVPNLVVSQSIIKTLPGFPGNLPFKLETGYVGVGHLEEVQLFYYFIDSERSPRDDPLVLWLTGGPGCSGFSALVYEIGPLTFNYANFTTGDKPQFSVNPYSWTKVANIIFLDQPVGTGFSYAKTSQGFNIGDISSAAQTYEFLRKWLVDHPKFLSNPLYIAGDSYSGMTVPIIVQEVSNGIEQGHVPPMNIKGYLLGNPYTDVKYDLNSRIIFARRKALLSKQLYESTKTNCKGQYMRPDTNNSLCMEDLQVVTKCLEKIYTPQVLEPKCSELSPKPIGLGSHPSFLGEHSMDIHLSTSQIGSWCRNYNYLLSYIWSNDRTVQNALHVREGTIEQWERCNRSFPYTYAHDIVASIDYQRNLTKKTYRALIYSGDHDMVIPYVGTQEWIESLGLPINDDWKPWFVDGQIAGYTLMYSLKKYSLTYVTVKGAGHTAPEYKPKECLAMIDRWFAYTPL